MKNYTISRNKVTKEMISKYQNYFFTGWKRTVILLCSLLGFAFAVTSFYIKDYIQTGLMIAVAIFGLAEVYLITNKRKKDFFNTFGEQEELMFSFSFGSEYFVILNVNTKVNARVYYTEITKIDKVDEGYIIVTKNEGFFIINKESLQNGITELNDYLKAQGVKLAKWPK